jgi:very-short-patch-repair endonuclease
MKIFSTLTPEQIDERRTQSEGVLGLKRFIQFAQQENTAMDRNRADKESNENLIHQIATCLEKNGYKVNTSVGTSDFRIDIAVIDPLDDEKYILGIICDGERYYRLKTARDREIVQPSVLKRLGWNLMHVWALDWFMHPEMVTKNILERLENIK